MGFHSALDQIRISPYIRVLWENGLKEECVNEFKGSAAHEMGHREKLHVKICNYYQDRAEETNQQVLNKLYKAQENEADVLGCLNLGNSCHMLRDSFKKRTISNNNVKVILLGSEDCDGSNTHPPTKKRIKKLNQIIHDMEEEDKVRYFNPLHKTNNLPRCFDCEKNEFEFFEK